MTKKKLLIATRNKDKIPEITSKLQELNLEFLILDDIPNLPQDYEIEETSFTF